MQLLSASYPNYNLRFATPGQFQLNWDVLLLYRRKNSKRLVNPSGARWTNGFAELAAMTFTFPQSNFNGPDQKVHPFQKSLACMRWLVQNLTEPRRSRGRSVRWQRDDRSRSRPTGPPGAPDRDQRQVPGLGRAEARRLWTSSNPHVPSRIVIGGQGRLDGRMPVG